MKTLAVALLCLFPLANFARAADVIPIKVLYAGNPGSPREADFVAFLQNHFAKVTKAKLTDVTADLAKDCDVVILDWTTIFPRDAGGKIDESNGPRIDMPPIPTLGEDYARPTILIGAVAGHFGDQNKLKISWLCLCLNDAAHGMKTEHDIFNRPLKVNMQLKDYPTPENYREFPEGKDLPATMPALTMQTKTYPEIDPGLVSPPYGFEDSPDCEVISGGLNMKGPSSVAIGRQGNFLQWGFAAQPSDMTEPARAAFVNAVVYIKKFDGQRPLFKRVAPGRESAVIMAHVLAKYPQVADYFGPELTAHIPAGAFEEFVQANIEYIRAIEEFKFDLDLDLKSLGLSNRKLELLEKCVTMLEKNDQADLARTLLTRYTNATFDSPDQWRKWLNDNRQRMYFTDVGGFKWMIKPAGR